MAVSVQDTAAKNSVKLWQLQYLAQVHDLMKPHAVLQLLPSQLPLSSSALP